MSAMNSNVTLFPFSIVVLFLYIPFQVIRRHTGLVRVTFPKTGAHHKRAKEGKSRNVGNWANNRKVINIPVRQAYLSKNSMGNICFFNAHNRSVFSP